MYVMTRDSEKTKKAVREWLNNIIREANNKLARKQKNQQFGKH